MSAGRGVRASGDGARAGRGDDEPLRFLFTIDTEISMGGAAKAPGLRPVGPRRRIWGETSRGAFGISRFMDVFDEHGLKAVFFFEPVARAVVGAEELEAAARYVVARGHDVELHVHPEFEIDLARVQRREVKSPSKNLFDHGLDVQRRYIRESAECLARWTGRRPIAFRAGGYSADERTLEALVREGITIDSSYSEWAIGIGFCGMVHTPPINDVAILDPGVVEVPVTNVSTLDRLGGLRPLELSSLGAREVIAALEQLWAARARVACSVTHSFRLVKARDPQYRDVEPDLVNLLRLRAVCRFLAEHRDRFEVCTFRSLPIERWRAEAPRVCVDRGAKPRARAPFHPRPPLWSSLARAAVQVIKDRGAV
ncbi:hypothetical protein L6R52_01780 [Myxococcota bacterium]|nr:hypothetical protein [Myxococcota bacterium]